MRAFEVYWKYLGAVVESSSPPVYFSQDKIFEINLLNLSMENDVNSKYINLNVKIDPVNLKISKLLLNALLSAICFIVFLFLKSNPNNIVWNLNFRGSLSINTK